MKAVNYRGFEIEKVEGMIQAGGTLAQEVYAAGTKRPKTRKIGTQYIITLPDGGTKTVSTMKHAREYIDKVTRRDAPNRVTL